MNFDPQKYHRRSIRLKGYDYTQPGAYFVTLVTWHREEIFGAVAEGEMRLNPLGEIVREEWLKTAEIRSNLELQEDEYIIMPNHVHGIIWIVETQPVRATRGPIESTTVGATRRVAPTKGSRTLAPGSIGAILAQFKSITAKRINALRGTHGVAVWQRNYFERIIRGKNELGSIYNYIHNNPLKWQEDKENPALLLLEKSRS